MENPLLRLQEFLPAGINSDNFIWSIFLLLVGIFAIYSLLLLYHWLRYGSLYATVWVMMIVYFGVSFLLVSTMFGSVVALT